MGSRNRNTLVKANDSTLAGNCNLCTNWKGCPTSWALLSLSFSEWIGTCKFLLSGREKQWQKWGHQKPIEQPPHTWNDLWKIEQLHYVSNKHKEWKYLASVSHLLSKMCHPYLQQVTDAYNINSQPSKGLTSEQDWNPRRGLHWWRAQKQSSHLWHN